MKAMKPEVVGPAVAVMAWKSREFQEMELAILRHALEHHYVYPGDVPETAVAFESRQGVASNAWNVLTSLEVLERVPLSFTDESRGIVCGRKRNKNPNAKGRWTAVYALKSRALALAFVQRCLGVADQPEPTGPLVQKEFAYGT